MKNIIALGIAISLLTLVSWALQPVQLSGNAGRAALGNISNETLNGTENRTAFEAAMNASQTGGTTTGSPEDLWGWGSVPQGYKLNDTGKLVRISSEEVDWIPGV